MQFIATGQVTLDGVTFILEADSLADAKAQIAAGVLPEYETDSAATIDWKVVASTLREDR